MKLEIVLAAALCAAAWPAAAQTAFELPTAQAAVQMALQQHPAVSAQRAAVAIAEAELDQAGRWPNPGFSFARSNGGGEVELARGLSLGLGPLIAMPWLREMQARRVRQTEAETAARLSEIATGVRKAWVQAVAAQESLRVTQQVQQAAVASAELARRMVQAGNFSALQQLREQGFEADAALAVLRAELVQAVAREQLVRALGATAAQAATLRLPDKLPELPADPPGAATEMRLEQRTQQRADIAAAREQVAAAEADLARTRSTRFVHTAELGLTSDSATGRSSRRGFEVGIELPLFDNGSARIARAEAARSQAAALSTLTESTARSQARESEVALRGAWLVARHHQQVLLPLKRRISQENLLRYNGMLIGVFELLADTREQIAAVHAALDALRDYWLAAADFDAAIGLKPAVMPAP